MKKLTLIALFVSSISSFGLGLSKTESVYNELADIHGINTLENHLQKFENSYEIHFEDLTQNQKVKVLDQIDQEIVYAAVGTDGGG